MPDVSLQLLFLIIGVLSLTLVIILVKFGQLARESYQAKGKIESLESELANRKAKEANAAQVDSYKLVVEDTAAGRA